MEMDFGVIADNGHTDSNGKLYILGEFRYIFASQVPARHGQMVAIARLTAEAVEVRSSPPLLELEIVDQDGQAILPRSPKFPLSFAPAGPAERGKATAQVVTQLTGIVLPA